MSEERGRKAREVAFKRRRGASEAHAQKVSENLLGADDLFTTCQHCRLTVKGTLEDLREHARGCHG